MTDVPAAVSPSCSPPARLGTLIRELQSLPPLPEQAQVLLAELVDPELDVNRVLELIERSPPIAARLLGIARSAFFAGPIPARDLGDAVIRVLGLRLVRDLSISLLLSAPFERDRCPAFDPGRYWRRAMLTATLAEALAAKVPGDREETLAGVYLAGLLHNLGLLVLVHLTPEVMDEVFIAAADDPERGVAELTRQRLGLDHCLAGAALARAWQLPPGLAVTMARHGEPDYDGGYWRLVQLVGFAERFATLAERHPETAGDLDLAPPAALGVEADEWRRTASRWCARIGHLCEMADAFS
ncbi:HDOD domain-containing protein [Marichromatium sp. AB32]|nr:HDOD domain-containing protein [Marichromatium sp. AB32]